MRKLAILTFQSLDGVMQAPNVPEEDFSGNFKHGGWAQPWWNEVMEQVVSTAMSEPYDLLLGGKTYDIFASSFSTTTPDNPVSEMLNKARKYIVTSRPEKLHWQNSVKISGNLKEELRKVKNLEGPLLQVHGSWQLIQFLLQHDLIDEFRLWTFPVTLGAGKRLLSGQKSMRKDFELIQLDKTENGVIQQFFTRR